jgi:N-acetylmuramoyl-L-alanine amidase
MAVVIDPGHGGDDSGAVGITGVLEKVVNLAIALKVGAYLERKGISVIYTRLKDETPGGTLDNDLWTRCNIANRAGATCFISIHANSVENKPEACGAEIFCYESDTKGYSLAKDVLAGLINNVPEFPSRVPQQVMIPDNLVQLDSRGTKEAHFYVLKYTNMPAALVEVAFLSNPIEEAHLKNPAFQERAAEGIAKGICNYLGVPWNVWNPEAEIHKLYEDGLIKNTHLPGDCLTWGEFATVFNKYRGRS